MIEQLKSFYAKQFCENNITVEKHENSTYSVDFHEEYLPEMQWDLLILPGYSIKQTAGADADTSWCERYGVVTKIYISIIYTPIKEG